MAPFSDFDRSSNRVAEHIEHRVVLGQDPRFEAPESICPGHRREPFQQDRAESLALKRIADREGGLGGTVAEVEIGAHGDGAKLPVQQAERDHRRLIYRLARVAESVDERLGRIGQVEEPPPARLGGQLVEEAPQGGVVCRPRDTERGDGAVAEHYTRVELAGGRRRLGHEAHRAALVTATRASGSTNSRSGWRTVSTGHGAMRTTCSATLPSSR